MPLDVNSDNPDDVVDSQIYPQLPKKKGAPKIDLPGTKPGRKPKGGSGSTGKEYPDANIIAFCDILSDGTDSAKAKSFEGYLSGLDQESKKITSIIEHNNGVETDYRKQLGISPEKNLDEAFNEYLEKIDQNVDALSGAEKEKFIGDLLKNLYREKATKEYEDVKKAQRINQGLRKSKKQHQFNEDFEKQPATKEELYALIQLIDDSINNQIYVFERMRDSIFIASNQVQDTRLQQIEYKLEHDGDTFVEFIVSLALQFFVVGAVANLGKNVIARIWKKKVAIDKIVLETKVNLRSTPSMFSQGTAPTFEDLVDDVKQLADKFNASQAIHSSIYFDKFWEQRAKSLAEAFGNTGLGLKDPIKSLFSSDDVDHSATTDGPCAAVCREVNRSITTKISNYRISNYTLKNKLLRMINEYDQIPEEQKMKRSEICDIRKEVAFYLDISAFEKELDVFEKTTELYIWYKYILAIKPINATELEKARERSNEGRAREIQEALNEAQLLYADEEIPLTEISNHITNKIAEINRIYDYIDTRDEDQYFGHSKDSFVSAFYDRLDDLEDNLVEYLAKRFNRYAEDTVTESSGPLFGGRDGRTISYRTYNEYKTLQNLANLFFEVHQNKDNISTNIMQDLVPSNGYIIFRQAL